MREGANFGARRASRVAPALVAAGVLLALASASLAATAKSDTVDTACVAAAAAEIYRNADEYYVVYEPTIGQVAAIVSSCATGPGVAKWRSLVGSPESIFSTDDFSPAAKFVYGAIEKEKSARRKALSALREEQTRQAALSEQESRQRAAEVALKKWNDDVGGAASAYYDCVARMAAEMALASGEPAETIAKGAKASCSDKRSSLINVFAVGVSAGELTDLGVSKLIEEVDDQASNRAIAAAIVARATNRTSPTLPDAEQAKALDKDLDDTAKTMADCEKANADEMALASSEAAETVAKAAVALCSKEVQDFAEADARTVGRHASPASIEEAERIASGPLIARVIAARAAAARSGQTQPETQSVPTVHQRDF